MSLLATAAVTLRSAPDRRDVPQTSANQDAAGRKAFVEMGCYQCHGYEGQGGSAGPRVAPPLGFDAFTRVLRKPYGVMPAYSPKVLSEEKLKQIYEYLRSIPPPPEPASLPLLSGRK